MRRLWVLSAVFLFLGMSAQAQTLRIGLASDPDALDPTISRTVAGRQVFAAMCDKLVDIDANLTIVPQLATAWTWQDDNRTLVLTLRPGVQFHDGSTMDSAAVVASLQRHLNLPGSTRKPEMGPIERIEASGPLEVRIHLSQPFAPLLAALSDRSGMIMSTKAAALSGADFAAHPVCAGPFRFVRRIAQDRMELERFPEYWDAKSIHFDRVIYFPIPDPTVRSVGLRGGTLDLIETVQPTDIPTLKADKRLQVMTGPSLSSYYIAVNIADGPRANTKIGQSEAVREALDLSIDRKALVDVAFEGLFIPGNQTVPPGSPFYVASIPVPGRDVARAKAVLKQAGFDRVTVQMTIPNSADYQQAAEVIQSMAADAGIDIQLVKTETATLLANWTSGDFESLLIQWSGRTDVDANLYNFNACGMALNGGHYCNPKLDEALNAGRSTTDMAQRMVAYTNAAQIYLKDRPYIYLWHPVLVFGATAKLDGLRVVPDSLIRFPGLQLKS
ncbi:ABC transporter substrate-binding protein [Acidisphaera sp. L21]|uniref:ABC transporter substrate-binding protein n=1 Tax=Acidisphaera sp. L21 TaxID=1641851 RepID=UPI00131D280B|nr:ABC transporter substrate-binding protein [Acidisphaera sp. L21]